MTFTTALFANIFSLYCAKGEVLMKKKAVAFFVMLFILMGGFTVYVLGHPVFEDVPPDHPAYAEITYLANIDIIAGFEDGTYRPDLLLSREYFATIIIRTVRHFGTFEVTENTTSILTDVPTHRWSNVYIANAINLNIINASDYGNVFRPQEAITIEEAVVWVMRIIVGTENALDRNTALVVARTMGIIVDVVEEDAPMTRTQAAVFIKRMIDTFSFEVIVTGDGVETHTLSPLFGQLLLDLLPSEPDAIQPSYHFDGWFLEDGTRVNALTRVEQNLIVFPRWRSIYSTITIISDGSPTEVITPRTGGQLFSYLPIPPERPGYRFSGWYLYGGNRVNHHMLVVTDTTVVARWNNVHVIERSLWTLFGNQFEQEILDVLHYHPIGRLPRIIVTASDFEGHISYSISPDNNSILFTTSNFLWPFLNRIEISATILCGETNQTDEVIFVFTVFNSLWLVIILLIIMAVSLTVYRKRLKTLIINETFDVEIRMRKKSSDEVKPAWIFIGRCTINPLEHEKLNKRKFTLLEFNRVCVEVAEKTKQAGFEVATIASSANKFLLKPNKFDQFKNFNQFKSCTFDGQKDWFVVKTPRIEKSHTTKDDSTSKEQKKLSIKEILFGRLFKPAEPKPKKVNIFKHLMNVVKNVIYMRFGRQEHGFVNTKEGKSISFEVADTETYDIEYTLFKPRTNQV